MIHLQHLSQVLTPAQEGQQMLVGILVVLLVVVLTLVIGHLVLAGPEQAMDAAVQRHVAGLNSRYERLLRPEPIHPKHSKNTRERTPTN